MTDFLFVRSGAIYITTDHDLINALAGLFRRPANNGGFALDPWEFAAVAKLMMIAGGRVVVGGAA